MSPVHSSNLKRFDLSAGGMGDAIALVGCVHIDVPSADFALTFAII